MSILALSVTVVGGVVRWLNSRKESAESSVGDKTEQLFLSKLELVTSAQESSEKLWRAECAAMQRQIDGLVRKVESSTTSVRSDTAGAMTGILQSLKSLQEQLNTREAQDETARITELRQMVDAQESLRQELNEVRRELRGR